MHFFSSKVFLSLVPGGKHCVNCLDSSCQVDVQVWDGWFIPLPLSFFFFQFKSPELEVFQDHSSSTQEMLVLIS